MSNEVSFKKIHELAKLPVRGSDNAVGYDLHSVLAHVLDPGDWWAVPTGLELAGAPEDLDIQIRPRSGLAFKKGVTVLNAPGTVDPDYRGEIKVILINHSKAPYKIFPGDRIAQMVFAKFETPEMKIVQEKSETARGAGGFGSTGK